MFEDVASVEWYAGYVGTAYTYGIVTGQTATTFDPGGTITRQEAAVMVARAAKLCGMDTEMDTAAIRDMLAQFVDYVQVADWARRGPGVLLQRRYPRPVRAEHKARGRDHAM